jgi:hypothetical protein
MTKTYEINAEKLKHVLLRIEDMFSDIMRSNSLENNYSYLFEEINEAIAEKEERQE